MDRMLTLATPHMRRASVSATLPVHAAMRRSGGTIVAGAGAWAMSPSKSVVRLASARVGRARGSAMRATRFRVVSERRAAFLPLKDIKAEDATALGLEIRNHSIKGALIDTSSGAFVGSGVGTKLDDLSKEDLEAALGKVVDQYGWKGLVGCSITKAVARGLGVHTSSFSAMDREVGAILQSCLPHNQVITLIHTEAAGYAELAYDEEEEFNQELVLVVTLGRAIGAVLYKDGHRLRNTGMNSKYTSTWEEDLDALEMQFPDAFPKSDSGVWMGLPSPESDAWQPLVDTTVRYLAALCDYVAPDSLIVMPTGAAANQLDIMEALVAKVRTAAPAFERPPRTVRMSGTGGTMVKGAAVGAVVEHGVKAAVDSLRSAVEGQVVMLQRLTPLQLRAVFDVFDADADGVCTREEVAAGLKLMGVQVDAAALEQTMTSILTASFDDDATPPNSVNFQMFSDWWQRQVKQALVTKITSGEEFKDILERDSSAKLVVLQVGFTFCRPCLAFEPKYERLARQYGDAARLVKVNGNENGNTIELCRDQLKVERTPTFIFFRDGQEIHRHTGINLDVFHEAMAEAGLELGPTEDN